MENKVRDAVIELKWGMIIIFITFWAAFLLGVWAMNIRHTNSVNIGSSGDGSSIKINKTNP